LHFKLLVEGSKIAGILDPNVVKFDHMGFGLVLKEVEEEKKEEGKEEETRKEETKKEEVKKEEVKTVEGKKEEGK